MIRWGIIGLGNVAKDFASGFKNLKNAKLLSIASKTEKKISYFKKRFNISEKFCFNDYEDLINCDEVDIVYIALPHSFHFDMIMKCLINQKRVLTENPATTSFNQMKLISEKLDKNKIFFSEGFMYRYHPQTNKILSLIKNDEIGDLISMESFFGLNILKRNIDFNNRLFNKELAGGCIFDLGCYPTSMSLLIASLKLNSNYSFNLENIKIERLSNLVDVDSYANINFSNKFTSFVGCSFKKDLGKSTKIIGTKGSILVHDSWQCNPSAILLNDQKLIKLTSKFSNIFSYQIESISNSILDGNNNPKYPGMQRDETENNQLILDNWSSE